MLILIYISLLLLAYGVDHETLLIDIKARLESAAISSLG
jgi:hypothetical protein